MYGNVEKCGKFYRIKKWNQKDCKLICLFIKIKTNNGFDMKNIGGKKWALSMSNRIVIFGFDDFRLIYSVKNVIR